MLTHKNKNGNGYMVSLKKVLLQFSSLFGYVGGILLLSYMFWNPNFKSKFSKITNSEYSVGGNKYLPCHRISLEPDMPGALPDGGVQIFKYSNIFLI